MSKYNPVRVRTRKYDGKCENCGSSLCACKVYQYVDENNAAITENSPYLCAKCYEAQYSVKIPTDVGRYRNNLISHLERLAASVGNPDTERALNYVIKYIIKNP